MNSIHHYTPVRVAIPFILGIWLVFQKEVVNSPSAGPVLYNTAALALFILMLVMHYQWLRFHYRLRWMAGLFAFLAFLTAGWTLAGMQSPESQSKKVQIPAESHLFLCRIESGISMGMNRCTGKGKIIALGDSAGNFSKARFSAMLYFLQDTGCLNLQTGDLILVKSTLMDIPSPVNPSAFDYRKYLRNKNIFYQCNIDSGCYVFLKANAGDPLKRFAAKSREAFMDVFSKFQVTGQDFALISALLLGDTEYLDPEIRQEFSYAGATHVLSVSGLHVGIVYVAADKIFQVLRRSKKGRQLHTVLTIGTIWLYALITGMSTPVTRAALMFSLVAAGNLVKRNNESFNIVAVAAFLQLWTDPLQINDVGFQLSYLAVAGIFAFYKPINELVPAKNRLVTMVWPILAVSVAAQLTTTPIAISCFKMFPVYFLLTNLIVVPLSGWIIYYAIFLLFVGLTGIYSGWLAMPLNWSLQFMRESVSRIQSWPGAVVDQVYVSDVQVMVIYFILVAGFGWLILEQRRMSMLFLIGLIVFAGVLDWRLWKTMRNNSFTVYSVHNRTGVDFAAGRQGVFIADSLLLHEQGKIKSRIQPNRISEGIRKLTVFRTDSVDLKMTSGTYVRYPFVFNRGKRVIFVSDVWNKCRSDTPLACDFAIISGSRPVDPEIFGSLLLPDTVIIDSSVPYYLGNALRQALETKGICSYAVRESGAFTCKW